MNYDAARWADRGFTLSWQPAGRDTVQVALGGELDRLGLVLDGSGTRPGAAAASAS